MQEKGGAELPTCTFPIQRAGGGKFIQFYTNFCTLKLSSVS